MIDVSEGLQHVVDVIILGGGLAGLGAGLTISNANESGENISYLILEAQNRAGGRVKSEELLEFNSLNRKKRKKPKLQRNEHLKFVDIGAQWLHGSNNQLYSISEKQKLLTSDQSEEGLGCFLYENSERIDSYLVKKVEFEIGRILEECEQFAHSVNIKMCPKSVGHFLRERFKKFVDNIDEPQARKQAMDLFDWHIRFQIIDNSCNNLDDLSAKYWGKYSFNGEPCQAHYNFKSGFQSVVDYLVRSLNNDSILYNKEVVEIQICERQTKANLKNKPKNCSNISVRCSDGSVFLGKSVLVTFSLGVLKKTHETIFRPPLPLLTRRAIESIGFSAINKIFLEFELPWWDDLDGIQFIWESQHKDKVFRAIMQKLVFRFSMGFCYFFGGIFVSSIDFYVLIIIVYVITVIKLIVIQERACILHILFNYVTDATFHVLQNVL